MMMPFRAGADMIADVNFYAISPQMPAKDMRFMQQKHQPVFPAMVYSKSDYFNAA